MANFDRAYVRCELVYLMSGLLAGLALNVSAQETVAESDIKVLSESHAHTEVQIHAHEHNIDSWRTVDGLSSRVIEHKSAVDKNTNAITEFTNSVAELKRQCESFQTWQEEQERMLGSLKADTRGTRVLLGANECPEDEACTQSQDEMTIENRLIDIHLLLKNLQEPEWISKINTLTEEIAQCSDGLSSELNVIETLRARKSDLQLAHTPNSLEIERVSEEDDQLLINIAFEVGTEDENKFICGNYKVFAHLALRGSNEQRVSSIESARAKGGRRCLGGVKIPGPKSTYLGAEIFIVPQSSKTTVTLR